MSTTSGSGITFGGLSSGIDTTSIIDKLVKIAQVPITNLQTKQQTISSNQSIYSQLKSTLTAFQTAANALDATSDFNVLTASSSDTSVASISGGTGSVSGTYSLSVSQLAQAQKISSSAQTDTTSALGIAGTFEIGGKAVKVTSSDSLQTIAQNINSLGVGVTASLIDGGSGSAYMTLTSKTTGVSNGLQLSNMTGDVLGSLGLMDSTSSVRESITNGATSTALSDSKTAVGTLMGSSVSGNIQINGTSVAIDTSTDTLQGIADKINTANISGITASVRTVTVSGTSTYKLDITGSTTPTFTDSGNVLGSLGIVQAAPKSELIPAKDAKYSLDNIPLTSPTNSITTAIPGATLSLLKGNVTTTSGGTTSTAPSTSTLTLGVDTSGLTTKIQAYVSAYNSMQSYISQNSQWDSSTNTSGALLGDSTVQQIQSSISTMLFQNVPGAGTDYKNLADIGFSLDQSGQLQSDSTKLSTALSTHPDEVAKLFAASGTGSTSDIQYISNTSASKTSTTGYAINVTRLATKESYTAGTSQTSANNTAETLTFGGSLMGGSDYNLTLDVGSTLDTAVSKINNDSTLKNLVFATNVNGKLHIDSKKYGGNGNFTVVSNQQAGSSNSGVGFASTGTTVLGMDIMGTINGEAATGNGQFLTGNSGNATTEGLQVQYTGSTSGVVGTLTFGKGVASQLSDLVTSFTDSKTGILTLANTAFTNEISDIQKQIDSLNDQVASEKTSLQKTFADMESAISKMQSDSQRLSSLSSSSSG